MLTIRLPKSEWAKAWRAMIEIAPVRLIAPDPVYEVLPAHVEMLKSQGITYSLLPQRGNLCQPRASAAKRSAALGMGQIERPKP